MRVLGVNVTRFLYFSFFESFVERRAYALGKALTSHCFTNGKSNEVKRKSVSSPFVSNKALYYDA